MTIGADRIAAERMIAEHRDGLIEAALEVRKRAYAPYSNFLVGSAILSKDGEVSVGCNVENASYSLAICAERSAIANMVAKGICKIEAVAVASAGGVAPCGACRQSLFEFGPSIHVILIDANKGEVTNEFALSDLLPAAFDKGDL